MGMVRDDGLDLNSIEVLVSCLIQNGFFDTYSSAGLDHMKYLTSLLGPYK